MSDGAGEDEAAGADVEDVALLVAPPPEPAAAGPPTALVAVPGVTTVCMLSDGASVVVDVVDPGVAALVLDAPAVVALAVAEVALLGLAAGLPVCGAVCADSGCTSARLRQRPNAEIRLIVFGQPCGGKFQKKRAGDCLAGPLEPLWLREPG